MSEPDKRKYETSDYLNERLIDPHLDTARRFMNHNMGVPAKEAKFALTPEDIVELYKIQKDIVYWAANYYYIARTVETGEIDRKTKRPILKKIVEPINLYEYQKDAVQKFFEKDHMIFVASRQLGKALALDTPIPTPTGWTTMGELKDGDVIFDQYGGPTTVEHAWGVQENKKCYRLTFSNGEEIVADAEHNWLTKTLDEDYGTIKTTEQILETLSGVHRISIHHNLHLEYGFTPSDSVYIKAIEEVDSVPVRCITVDSPDELFLCGKTCIPTHNTTVLILLALWFALYNPNRKILIFSHMESSAKSILKRVKDAYALIPNHLKPYVEKWSATEIEFGNGSVIKCGPTSSKSGHGEVVDLLLADEFDHVTPNVQKEFIEGISPTVSTSRGKMYICSSVKSSAGSFYTFYKNAQPGAIGEMSWSCLVSPWYEAKDGRCTCVGKHTNCEAGERWKQTALAELGGQEDIWRRQFECDFTSDPDDGMPNLMQKNGFLSLELQERMPLCDFDHNISNFRMYQAWEHGRIYTIGGDVSEGVGQNYSTLQVLDITDLTNIIQVAEYQCNTIHPVEFANIIVDIAEYYHTPWLAIERNNHGGLVLDTLSKEHSYPKIIQWGMKNDKKAMYQRLGINAQGNSKKAAITNMRYYLDRRLAIRINSSHLMEELRSFKKLPNGSWRGINAHDDLVDAFNWALSVLHADVIDQCFSIIERDDLGRPKIIVDKNPDASLDIQKSFEEKQTVINLPSPLIVQHF